MSAVLTKQQSQTADMMAMAADLYGKYYRDPDLADREAIESQLCCNVPMRCEIERRNGDRKVFAICDTCHAMQEV